MGQRVKNHFEKKTNKKNISVHLHRNLSADSVNAHSLNKTHVSGNVTPVLGAKPKR